MCGFVLWLLFVSKGFLDAWLKYMTLSFTFKLFSRWFIQAWSGYSLILGSDLSSLGFRTTIGWSWILELWSIRIIIEDIYIPLYYISILYLYLTLIRITKCDYCVLIICNRIVINKMRVTLFSSNVLFPRQSASPALESRHMNTMLVSIPKGRGDGSSHWPFSAQPHEPLSSPVRVHLFLPTVYPSLTTPCKDQKPPNTTLCSFSPPLRLPYLNNPNILLSCMFISYS